MLIRTLVFASVALAIACARPHTAARAISSTKSDAKHFCMAPESGSEDGPVAWPSNDGMVDDAQDPRRVANLLSGTWEVLTVASEGVNDARGDLWRLRLVPTDSAVWVKCWLGPCRSDRLVTVAAGSRLRAGVMFDSSALARRESKDPQAIRAEYDRRGNQLTLAFGPPAFDAGTFYSVTEVTDSTFQGRWTDGSLVVLEVNRGDVTTLEHPSGFFCARKIGA